MLLSMGGWGEGKTPEDGAAIALEAVFGAGEDDDVELTFPPAATSPWCGKTFLGRLREPGELSDDDRA
jgi:hypothetical protein